MTEGRPTATERVLAGRYRLLRPLDCGGMTEVWEARDEVLARPVAIKLLVPDLTEDRDFVARFRTEAIAAARLVHPNIVSVFDTGAEGDDAFIVRELVPGVSLRDTLAQAGGVDLHQAVEIGAQVAEALDHAHTAGIVHRDVRPANILLPGDGRVLVSDFGVARARADGDDDAGPSPYRAPEQLDDGPTDARTDIYGLGAVLYEMVCGRPPLPAAGEDATAESLPPRRVRAGIPRTLEQVVLRALAPDPAERFPSAADLRAALLAVDLGEDDAVPLVVRDDTPPEGVPTFGQSERSWLVPAAAIVVVAVALGVAGVLFARTDVGREFLGTNPRAGSAADGGAPPALVSPRLFDPQGDGDEHSDEVPFLVDGDDARGWETHQYHGPRFGGLKNGVGLIFAVDGGSRRLPRLVVTSPTRGWNAEVYVTDKAGTSLGDWGRPVAAAAAIDGDATFDLGGYEGSAVLLWITDPGPARKLVIGEVALAR